MNTADRDLYYCELPLEERRAYLEKALQEVRADVGEINSLGLEEMDAITKSLEDRYDLIESAIPLGDGSRLHLGGISYDVAYRFMREEMNRALQSIHPEERKSLFDSVLGEFYYNPSQESKEIMVQKLKEYIDTFGLERFSETFKALYVQDIDLARKIDSFRLTGRLHSDAFYNPQGTTWWTGKQLEKRLGISLL